MCAPLCVCVFYPLAHLASFAHSPRHSLPGVFRGDPWHVGRDGHPDGEDRAELRVDADIAHPTGRCPGTLGLCPQEWALHQLPGRDALP
jgi:hypothetical protein